MRKILKFIRNIKIPTRSRLQKGFNALSQKELFIVIVATIVAFFALLSILGRVNKEISLEIPEYGGSITEGIIGMPTLVNPVLALSDADKDVTSLVYSGLMRKTPDGELIPDLAESYNISPDGTQYTFVLKNNLTFHDGKPLTVDDVVFTINKIQDPLVKSPRKTQWEGVEVIKKNEKTVIFVLKQPYASFINSTILGIMPMHLWKDITSPEFGLNGLNIKAVGSGPYMIKSVSKNSDGIPESYSLMSFKKFVLGKPYIRNIKLVSYANEKELVQALRNRSIDQAGGISPSYAEELAKKGKNIKTSILPRMFGLFFNSTENKLLSESSVRSAINVALDREALIDEVLDGYGIPINSPIPKNMEDDIGISSSTKQDGQVEEARAILEKAGWSQGEDGIYKKGGTKQVTTGTGKNKKTTTVASGTPTRLVFSITTGDAPELKQAAEKIKMNLLDLGIDVNIKIYETGELNQMIRSRKYEALLFGQVINHESDLFAFWHSSQRTDPGLNIAMYSNKNADAILDSAQKVLDRDGRMKKYAQFANLFKTDLPAVFIYSPYYIYIMSPNIHVQQESTVTVPADRFTSVYTWYTNVDMVWKIFK